MSEPQTSTAEILVHVVRSGVATQEIHLPEGSTVADLLKASGITTTSSIAIDGVPIEEAVQLVEGAVITIAPPAQEIGKDGFWGPPITAFQNDQLCREYWEALEAGRLDRVSEEDPSE
jgi:sulfur carrier protein ThiS